MACIACFGILTLVACTKAPEGARRNAPSAEVGAIRSVVDKYVASIDAADPELGRQVWAERDDISFIHPLGHEEGWAQIKSNFYEKLMGEMFSTRKLTIKRITIEPFGDAAVAVFYWEFMLTGAETAAP